MVSRVLLSVRAPNPQTNPFVWLLAKSLSDRLYSVNYFSWSRALWSRYDLFHIHWPENLFRAKSRPKRALKTALVVLLIARLRLMKTPVVWTVHNDRPHDKGGWLDDWLLDRFESLVTSRVYLTQSQKAAALHQGPVAHVIPHGHYRDVYRQSAGRRPDDLILAHVGQLRPYKGLDGLVAAFRGTNLDNSRLILAGRPNPQAYGEALLAAAMADSRIDVRPSFQTDHEVMAILSAASLVVLPYKNIGNSGVALLALSLDCPILAPFGGPIDELWAEVGSDWVLRYEGELTTDILAGALVSVQRRLINGTSPDLSLRDWASIGKQYEAVYRSAIDEVDLKRNSPFAGLVSRVGQNE